MITSSISSQPHFPISRYQPFSTMIRYVTAAEAFFLAARTNERKTGAERFPFDASQQYATPFNYELW